MLCLLEAEGMLLLDRDDKVQENKRVVCTIQYFKRLVEEQVSMRLRKFLN